MKGQGSVRETEKQRSREAEINSPSRPVAAPSPIQEVPDADPRPPGAGCLYGVGLGPGDSRLLTLRAVQVIEQSDIVFVPKPHMEEESLARKIAAPWLSGKDVRELVFPMITDNGKLAEHWRQASASVAGFVQEGKQVAFLTLGDPLLYSTFIYLMEKLKSNFPDLPIEVVPGIISPQACAAEVGIPLAKGREKITILPAYPIDRLESVLSEQGNVVIMKVGKNFPEIEKALARKGRLNQAIMVTRTGLDNSAITPLSEAGIPSGHAYLATIIVRD